MVKVNETSGGEIAFHAMFDPSIKVIIVFPESPSYQSLEKLFADKTHAFLMQDKKLLVIDGKAVSEPWFTKDHLRVIEAHEVAHNMAGHGSRHHSGRDETEEREADYIGYHLLMDAGLDSAATLHRMEYESRYGNFPENDDELMIPLMNRCGLGIND
jgi:hypothetical protein